MRFATWNPFRLRRKQAGTEAQQDDDTHASEVSDDIGNAGLPENPRKRRLVGQDDRPSNKRARLGAVGIILEGCRMSLSPSCGPPKCLSFAEHIKERMARELGLLSEKRSIAIETETSETKLAMNVTESTETSDGSDTILAATAEDSKTEVHTKIQDPSLNAPPPDGRSPTINEINENENLTGEVALVRTEVADDKEITRAETLDLSQPLEGTRAPVSESEEAGNGKGEEGIARDSVVENKEAACADTLDPIAEDTIDKKESISDTEFNGMENSKEDEAAGVPVVPCCAETTLHQRVDINADKDAASKAKNDDHLEEVLAETQCLTTNGHPVGSKDVPIAGEMKDTEKRSPMDGLLHQVDDASTEDSLSVREADQTNVTAATTATAKPGEAKTEVKRSEDAKEPSAETEGGDCKEERHLSSAALIDQQGCATGASEGALSEQKRSFKDSPVVTPAKLSLRDRLWKKSTANTTRQKNGDLESPASAFITSIPADNASRKQVEAKVGSVRADDSVGYSANTIIEVLESDLDATCPVCDRSIDHLPNIDIDWCRPFAKGLDRNVTKACEHHCNRWHKSMPLWNTLMANRTKIPATLLPAGFVGWALRKAGLQSPLPIEKVIRNPEFLRGALKERVEKSLELLQGDGNDLLLTRQLKDKAGNAVSEEEFRRLSVKELKARRFDFFTDMDSRSSELQVALSKAGIRKLRNSFQSLFVFKERFDVQHFLEAITYDASYSTDDREINEEDISPVESSATSDEMDDDIEVLEEELSLGDAEDASRRIRALAEGIKCDRRPEQVAHTRQLQEFLVSSPHKKALVEIALKEELLPCLLSFLEFNNASQLKAYALKVLSIFALEKAKVFFHDDDDDEAEHRTVSLLISLLLLEDCPLDEVLHLLGTIASANTLYRDALLSAGVMPCLVKVLEEALGVGTELLGNTTVLINGSHTLAHFCSGEPRPDLSWLRCAMPVLSRMVQLENASLVLLSNICLSLSLISRAADSSIGDAILKPEVCNPLLRWLISDHLVVQRAALATIKNLSDGTIHHKKRIVKEFKVLPNLKTLLLTSSDIVIQRHACQAIANLAKGVVGMVSFVFNVGLTPILLELLKNEDAYLVNAALSAVLHITEYARSDEIEAHLIVDRCISPLCNLLVGNAGRADGTSRIALEILKNLLVIGYDTRKGADSMIVTLICEDGGKGKLQCLAERSRGATEETRDMAHTASDLLGRYFR